MINDKDNSQTTNEELFYGTKAEDKSESVNVEDKKEVTDTNSSSVGNEEAQEAVDKAESEKNKDESKDVDSQQKDEGLKSEDLKVDESLFNKDELSIFVEKAQKLGLSKEQAQEFLNDKIQERSQAENNIKTQVDGLKKQWLDEVKADSEIGGAKLTESAELAKRASTQFGSEKFLEILNSTGFGNHPEFIRAFAKIGRQMANDKLVTGDTNLKPENIPTHKLFYPDQKS